MPQRTNGPLTAFSGFEIVASGTSANVAVALANRTDELPILIWTDTGGQQIDLDLRGSEAEIRARYAAPKPQRGRPKLGVVPREVTLLPRHWEWLRAQRGGASAALRRLVDQARKAEAETDAPPRQRINAAWQFMSAMAGDLPGFEEASRKLFAGDLPGAQALIAKWPGDIPAYVHHLLTYETPD